MRIATQPASAGPPAAHRQADRRSSARTSEVAAAEPEVAPAEEDQARARPTRPVVSRLDPPPCVCVSSVWCRWSRSRGAPTCVPVGSSISRRRVSPPSPAAPSPHPHQDGTRETATGTHWCLVRPVVVVGCRRLDTRFDVTRLAESSDERSQREEESHPTRTHTRDTTKQSRTYILIALLNMKTL